jgi:protein-tyrosine phosphatase
MSSSTPTGSSSTIRSSVGGCDEPVIDPSALVDEPARHLRLAGTRNLRDIGGYPAAGGRRTRWRTLFRTDALDALPTASQARLLDLGLRLVIDLRWPHELAALPSVFASSGAVRYRSIPLLDNAPTPAEGLPHLYRRMLDERGDELAAVVLALLEDDGLPAIIGCAGGIDRTGVTIGLILTAVGVPPDLVATDYALSAACFATDGTGAGLDDWRAGVVEVNCLPEYMASTLEHLDREHGGAARLLHRHGVGPADLAELVERLTMPKD